MHDQFARLQPQPIWNHFYQLTQIPRPSHHEEAVRAYVVGIGERLGLQVIRDESDNILIRKPASKGMEQAPGVILQGHLDMVPQANSDTRHDFRCDPIPVRIEQDWVTADGTTLGADNGIGVAAALAVLESPKLNHGPLEALFTCNEEDGMSGAKGLREDLLQGRYLLNMDSEQEGELCIGCAGGATVLAWMEYESEAAPGGGSPMRLSVTGLKGGHSGLDIHRGRANANVLLFRLLSRLRTQTRFRLSSVVGGNMRNAIPREAMADLLLPDGDLEAAGACIERLAHEISDEYRETEPQLQITVQAGETIEWVLPVELQDRLLDGLTVCPNGVVRMSDSMPGLVETSTNLSVVTVSRQRLEVTSLIRSAVNSARDELCEQHRSLFRLIGVESRIEGRYPGWQPDTQSRLLSVMRETYQALYNTQTEVGAIHAGLECGLIGGRYPDLEMISFGPTIQFPHSPDECMHIPSVQRFWDLLVATLSRLM